ncbi:hypothetical protein ACSBR2_010728 [Camellia fascicularis]
MASTSISFFTPPKPKPKPPPPKAPLLLPSLFSSLSKNRAVFVPLVASNEGYNPLSSSSSSDVLNVLYPSVAYANTLFFRSAYNVQVIVDDNEPEKKLLGRFRREVMRAGVIQECKRRKFFENKQDEKKRKSREAAKRNRRRRPQARGSFQDKEEASKSKKERESDEDNWELPEGNLPY